MLARARQLLGLGLAVIPIPSPGPGRDGKTPALAWRQYQERRPTLEEIEAWFTDVGDDPQNLAIVTGVVSGIVVVDCDSAEAQAWALQQLPETPWRVKTGRGLHLYFRHPGGRIRNKTRFGPDGLELDLRGDGGYVIGPDSIHASGVLYQPEGDWGVPLDQVPTLPLELLGAPRQPFAVPTRQPTSESQARVLDRARSYLAAIPGAVQGQGGDAHTFATACKLVRGFGLSEEEALVLLVAWNERCDPPWSERDLALKVRNALRYGEEVVGGRRDQPAPESAPVRMGGRVLAGGMHPDHPMADREPDPPARPAEDSRVRPWLEPASTFLEEPDAPEVFLVNELLPAQVLCLVHGEPRTRKSWFALELAVALATGTPAFGVQRFTVPAAVPVLYSSQEDARSRVRKRVRRFLAGRGVAAPRGLYLSVHADINLEDPSWQEAMLTDCKKLGLKVVILDPIRRYSPSVDKGPAEVRAVTAFLRKLSVDVGCTVVIVHHDVKPSQKDEDTRRRGHRASGGDWFAACEAPIHLEPSGKDRSLAVPEDYKFSEDPGAFVFEVQGKASDPSVIVVGADASVEDAKRLQLHERVLEYVGEHPGRTTGALCRGLKIRKESLLEALEHLNVTGQLDNMPGPRNSVLWVVPA